MALKNKQITNLIILRNNPKVNRNTENGRSLRIWSIANEQAAQQDEATDQNDDDTESETDNQEQGAGGENASVDYKTQYRYLKRKLKFLIYENEFFQDALRSNQRRLLKVSRDRAFLLDRLLQYEKTENSSSESDETESSEDEAKKRKVEQTPNTSTNGTNVRGRKKNINVTIPAAPTVATVPVAPPPLPSVETVTHSHTTNDRSQTVELEEQGHMSAAELERHLQSRQPVMELMPERAPMPTEMFSNEPSLDSESNDNHLIDGSSPTHVAAEECVPMEYSN